MLERNIVFNPKDAKSYLYLAKIYNHEEDQNKEEYNLETTLLELIRLLSHLLGLRR